MKPIRALDAIIYWSIIIMPFAVVISPAIANAFIGFFCVFFIIKKLIKKEGLLLDKGVLFPFLCLFAASLLSFVNSVSYNSSFGGLIKLLKYFLIFAVCAEEIRDRKHIKWIVLSACFAVSLAGIDGLWQYFLGYDFIHRIPVHFNIDLARSSASFPNPNVFGVYMSALTPLIAGLAIFYFKGKKRLLIIFAVFLGLVGIALTFSRGSALAVYLSILFLCVAGKKKILTASLIAVIALSPFFMPQKIKDWAKEINYNPVVFMLNEDRVSIYTNTINMIRHHPFIGVGVNTFSRNYGKYKTESAEIYKHTADTIYAHNIFLHLTGETGLLGLFAFLWFLFAVLRKAFRTFRNLPDAYLKAVSLSLIACIFAFLINGLTETSLYYPRVSMVFWYLIGASLALSKFTAGSPHEK